MQMCPNKINVTKTAVRKSMPATLRILNPLGHSVTLTTDTKVSEINLPPSFVLAPNSNGSCSFEFHPTKEGVTHGKLALHSNDLGTFFYELKLTVSDQKFLR